MGQPRRTPARRAVLVGAGCPGWEDRVDAAPADTNEAMLVRPDGYVAWAGSPAGGGLHLALKRWFGQPGPMTTLESPVSDEDLTP